MKLSAAEAKEQTSAPEAPKGPRYPWGLSLNLDNDSLDKLGLGLPDVGAEYQVVARAKVTSVSSNDSEGGSKNRSVSLQITDLGVSAGGSDGKAAEVLFGKE